MCGVECYLPFPRVIATVLQLPRIRSSIFNGDLNWWDSGTHYVFSMYKFNVLIVSIPSLQLERFVFPAIG